jgi:hypothetical protein
LDEGFEGGAPTGPTAPWFAGVFLAAWLGLSALACLGSGLGLGDVARRPGPVLAVMAGAALGPMAGAFCRDLQGCCLAFSLRVLPWSLLGLVVGGLLAFLLPARGPWWGALRLVSWTLGVAAWFGGGILSLGHALS